MTHSDRPRTAKRLLDYAPTNDPVGRLEFLYAMVAYAKGQRAIEAEAAAAPGLRAFVDAAEAVVDQWKHPPNPVLSLSSDGAMRAMEAFSSTVMVKLNVALEQARAALAAAPEDHSEEHWHRGPSQSCSICKFATPARPAVASGSSRRMIRALTAHQLDVLRDYRQLGTIAAVADFRGVQVATINNTLGIVRDKLGVKTTREALEAVARG